MRNITSLMVGGFAVGCLAVCNVQAVTYFSDGFEGQTDPLGLPTVGGAYLDASGTPGASYDIATGAPKVLAGTQSLKLLGSGGLIGTGTSGGLVAGNTIEYIFHVNLLNDGGSDTSHSFNNPIQIGLGFNNGSAGQLARIGLLAGTGDNKYGATDNGTVVNSTIVAPFGTAGFDTLRAVLTLTEPSPGMLGGTLDFSVAIDGSTTFQPVVTGAILTAVPAIANTAPSFRLQRSNGTISTSPFYDDITISDVPEPTGLAACGAAVAALVGRRRRSR